MVSCTVNALTGMSRFGHERDPHNIREVILMLWLISVQRDGLGTMVRPLPSSTKTLSVQAYNLKGYSHLAI